MNKTALTLASIVAAFGISAGAATAASAKPAELCTGKKIYAHQNGETLNGTCGNDTFIVGQYKTVFVYGNDGDDIVKVGWGGGKVEVHGGNGNDRVYNGGDKQVVIYGDGGNDSMEGGPFADQFFGGSGTDSACSGAGDTINSVESTFLC